ncbi:MAG: AAA family ATPase [Methyloprofundus sp.]|nr:AAA family ATPase [Methyloprofundus sp.]
MIITCDNCATKYQLDDSLIKKSLFKVRCSHCKATFMVEKNPNDDFIELVETHQEKSKQIIAICNQKGGVAKTSTCLNLGAALAAQNKRVLLIDFDVQSNLSLLFGCKNERSFYEVHESDIKPTEIIKKVSENLWLLPANSKLSLLARHYLRQKNNGYFLREHIEPLKQYFDYILIDTPPSVKFFTPNALLAADFVIVPTQCEFLSMNGVLQTESIIQALAKSHPLDYRVLVTLYDQRNMASKVIFSKLKNKYQNTLFNTAIEFDPKVQESQIINQPVTHYDANATASKQYTQLAKELLSI